MADVSSAAAEIAFAPIDGPTATNGPEAPRENPLHCSGASRFSIGAEAYSGAEDGQREAGAGMGATRAAGGYESTGPAPAPINSPTAGDRERRSNALLKRAHTRTVQYCIVLVRK